MDERVKAPLVCSEERFTELVERSKALSVTPEQHRRFEAGRRRMLVDQAYCLLSEQHTVVSPITAERLAALERVLFASPAPAPAPVTFCDFFSELDRVAPREAFVALARLVEECGSLAEFARRLRGVMEIVGLADLWPAVEQRVLRNPFTLFTDAIQ